MNITPLNLNFTAKLKRTLNSQYRYPGSKKDMEKSFDREIKKLKQQKAAAIEFDEFMCSDKVKDIMKQLPKDSSIEMFNSFELLEFPEDVDDSTPFSLTYIQHDKAADANEDDKLDDLNYSFNNKVFYGIQKSDGSIDKDAIKNWLNGLVSMFGSNNKN